MYKRVTKIALCLLVAATAAFAWTNILAEKTRDELKNNHSVNVISQKQLLRLMTEADFNDRYILIDVRTPLEYRFGRIPSAINIPHSEILANVTLLDEYNGKEMIFYCQSGVRAGKVLQRLTELHYPNLSYLEGDIGAWKANNLAVER